MSARSDGVDEILVDGPWTHRFVAANGSRFHVAEQGEGPLVLLLHGFPQFWWMWRHQLGALAESGYRAAALDLRGFGASDKPPRGHETFTATRDAAAVVRSLGADDAVLVGHGLGGWIAWATAYLHPRRVRALATISMPHPRVIRRAVLSSPRQLLAGRFLAGMQAPFLPERMMREDGYVAAHLASGAGSASPGFPSDEEVRRYTAALAQPFVADCVAEHYRWLVRSQLRSSGWQLAEAMKPPLDVGVLAVHGAEDPIVPAELMSRSASYVSGTFSAHRIPGIGHFVAEEAPATTGQLLTHWLDAQDLSPR